MVSTGSTAGMTVSAIDAVTHAQSPETTSWTPLDWAKAAIETMMRTYAAPDLPPKDRFYYHQGVFLSGVWQTADLTGEERYFRYVKDWMDTVLSSDGEIIHYSHGNVDDIQPGILLFGLIDRYGDLKYKTALDNDIEQISIIPKGPTGGYWHLLCNNSQLWLDSLYMLGPLMSEYAERYHQPEMADEVVNQAQLMFRHNYNPATGLLKHAWDARGVMPWVRDESKQSAEHWGRAIGWVPVALLDDADHFPNGLPGKAELVDLALNLLRAVLKYQSEEGRWYQVVDKGDREDNWLENSCSCLFVAALAKAVVEGYVTGDEAAQFARSAQRGYQAVLNSLTWEGENLQVGNVCVGTWVGDYQFYIDRPVHTNDLHGVGAFLLMCTQMQRLTRLGGASPAR